MVYGDLSSDLQGKAIREEVKKTVGGLVAANDPLLVDIGIVLKELLVNISRHQKKAISLDVEISLNIDEEKGSLILEIWTEGYRVDQVEILSALESAKHFVETGEYTGFTEKEQGIGLCMVLALCKDVQLNNNGVLTLELSCSERSQKQVACLCTA